MDDLEKFLDEAGKLLKVIEEQDARQKQFVNRLEKEMMQLATEHFPEIEDFQPETKKHISFKAWNRANELCDFMFKRIYDGVDDMEIDITKQHVPPRYDEEGNKLRLEKKLEKIDPEYHAVYIETDQEIQGLLRAQNEFVYDCFDKAKKALWVSFPEISNLTGNSILFMNGTAFDRMWYFMSDLYDIIG